MRAPLLFLLLVVPSCDGCAPSPVDDAGASDAASCVPEFKQCLAPAKCCAGLECVGGACAKVNRP